MDNGRMLDAYETQSGLNGHRSGYFKPQFAWGVTMQIHIQVTRAEELGWPFLDGAESVSVTSTQLSIALGNTLFPVSFWGTVGPLGQPHNIALDIFLPFDQIASPGLGSAGTDGEGDGYYEEQGG